MPIHISWDNDEKTIIRHTYEEPWTIAEYYDHIRKNYEAIDETGHIVDIINDLRELKQIPKGMIPAMRHAAQQAHRNEGINVMVAANTFARILIESVYKTMRRDTTELNFVDTIEEAHAMIAREQAKRRRQEPP